MQKYSPYCLHSMDLCCYKMNPDLSLVFRCFKINHWIAALVSFSFVWLCSEFSKSAKWLFQPDTFPCLLGRGDNETFLMGNDESYSYVHVHLFLNVLETFCKLLYKSFKWSLNGKLREEGFSHKLRMKDNELPLSWGTDICIQTVHSVQMFGWIASPGFILVIWISFWLIFFFFL